MADYLGFPFCQNLYQLSNNSMTFFPFYCRAWLVTSRGIAKKIKEPAQFSSKQIIEPSEEAKRECPNCNHVIDNSDVRFFNNLMHFSAIFI